MTTDGRTPTEEKSFTPLELAAMRFMLVAQLLFCKHGIDPDAITVTFGEGPMELGRVNLAEAMKELEDQLPLAPLRECGVVDLFF